jgi:lipopolysaccharide/colanic/teichoic acid biosynthesis glycosyltransferase
LEVYIQMKNERIAATAGRSGEDLGGRTGEMFPPGVFRALLRHERNRSDRDGSEFSLAVFDVSGMNGHGRGIRDAEQRIRAEMRSIDEIGWINPHSIGVLLPVTGGEGGHKFAQRVAGAVPFTIYTYPAHWLPGGKLPGGEDGAQTAKAADDVGKVFCRKIPLWKLFMDKAGSLLLIILFSPLFLLMAVYVKAVSPGKVFYKQKRVGYRGRIFTFIKFRTMHENNDAAAHRAYLKEIIKSGVPMEKLDGGRDPRIIPGGRLLRKTCLDELPQLFNVLRGDMSLVGPRPCIPYEAEEYLRWHSHRFDSLPGMTGLWQVSGKNKLSFEKMVRLDISYAARMSPLLDLKILLMTGPAIIKMVFEAVAKRVDMKVLTPSTVSMIQGGKEGSLGDA